MTEIDIESIKDIARKAGDEIMKYYGSKDLDIEVKEDETGHLSPLSAADTASHKLIVHELQQAYPDIPIVSEEQSPELNDQAMKSSQVWVIDPIDGTKGFINQNGEFTINIGLLEDGMPTQGVVYAPVHNLLYYTTDDHAHLDDGSSDNSIHASSNTSVKGAVASKNHMDATTKEFLDQFGDIEFVQAGSSLKLCKVATGEADIYPRLAPTTMEWDTAAADAILRKASAMMIDMDGNTLQYGKPDLRNLGFIAHAPNVTFTL